MHYKGLLWTGLYLEPVDRNDESVSDDTENLIIGVHTTEGYHTFPADAPMCPMHRAKAFKMIFGGDNSYFVVPHEPVCDFEYEFRAKGFHELSSKYRLEETQFAREQIQSQYPPDKAEKILKYPSKYKETWQTISNTFKKTKQSRLEHLIGDFFDYDPSACLDLIQSGLEAVDQRRQAKLAKAKEQPGSQDAEFWSIEHLPSD